jgi:anti-sigma28 factor (negative regulator of flagellin synthesis)
MATSKKTTKKRSAKKTSAKKATTAARVSLSFPIDAKKVEAIRRCLAKGSLKVTVSKADLLRGRLRDPYLYD